MLVQTCKTENNRGAIKKLFYYMKTMENFLLMTLNAYSGEMIY